MTSRNMPIFTQKHKPKCTAKKRKTRREALASSVSFHPFFNTVVSQKQEMQTRENTYKEKGVCMCRSHMLAMYPKQ